METIMDVLARYAVNREDCVLSKKKNTFNLKLSNWQMVTAIWDWVYEYLYMTAIWHWIYECVYIYDCYVRLLYNIWLLYETYTRLLYETELGSY